MSKFSQANVPGYQGCPSDEVPCEIQPVETLTEDSGPYPGYGKKMTTVLAPNKPGSINKQDKTLEFLMGVGD